MSRLEEWWLTDYADEIYNYLRAKEKERQLYHRHSSHFHIRRDLVVWTIDTCEKLGLCTLVQHLSVCLLDIFLCYHELDPKQIEIIALGCIIVAAKAEEKDSHIPKITDINRLMNNVYSLKDYYKIEKTILTFFRWEILMPTVAHFLDYFAVFSVSPTDRCNGEPLSNVRKIFEFMKEYLAYFCGISLKDHIFLQFPASIVAASCIACARICLLLSPVWSPTLEKLTHYSLDHMGTCINVLFQVLEAEDRASRLEMKRAAVQEEGRHTRQKLRCTASRSSHK